VVDAAGAAAGAGVELLLDDSLDVVLVELDESVLADVVVLLDELDAFEPPRLSVL
jgi:hypothetical protein